MREVRLLTMHGSHGAALAVTFLDRFLGIRRIGDAELVIVPGSSVHGVGLVAPLDTAGVSAGGVVIRVATLSPGRFLRFPGAAMVVEAPIGTLAWRSGERIAIREHNR